MKYEKYVKRPINVDIYELFKKWSLFVTNLRREEHWPLHKAQARWDLSPEQKGRTAGLKKGNSLRHIVITAWDNR